MLLILLLSIQCEFLQIIADQKNIMTISYERQGHDKAFKSVFHLILSKISKISYSCDKMFFQ